MEPKRFNYTPEGDAGWLPGPAPMIETIFEVSRSLAVGEIPPACQPIYQKVQDDLNAAITAALQPYVGLPATPLTLDKLKHALLPYMQRSTSPHVTGVDLGENGEINVRIDL